MVECPDILLNCRMQSGFGDLARTKDAQSVRLSRQLLCSAAQNSIGIGLVITWVLDEQSSSL